MATKDLIPHRVGRWLNEDQYRNLETVAEWLTVGDRKLDELAKHFVAQMRQGLGLKKSSVSPPDLAMIPTFVSDLPSENDHGCYLALDLGGTNLRVSLINLKGCHEIQISKPDKHAVPSNLHKEHVSHLMDFIATTIRTYINKSDIKEKITSDTLEMGFTFSFPVSQTAINSGKLLRWTKDFNCPGAVGEDVVQLLQTSLDNIINKSNKESVKVHITALINDTVGTLLAHSYSNPGTYIGAIFGTGTNGAYIEATENIKSVDVATKGTKMIVNTEWGNFSKCKRDLPVTIFDNKLDRESINPGLHVFEKLISGMYLGEITRNALLHLIDHHVLFQGTSSPTLNEQWGFKTEWMSKIEADESESLSSTEEILKALDIKLQQQSDREVVRFVCHLVGKRAARLSAMAIAAVIRHGLEMGTLKDHPSSLTLSIDGNVDVGGNGTDDGDLDKNGNRNTIPNNEDRSSDLIHVGIDGSVFEYYPHFKDHMDQGLVELLGQDAKRIVKLKKARYDTVASTLNNVKGFLQGS
ncbi:glucokinase [Mortierella sp. NVP85]|nr:glucokinase [Mortierella sp. NVP85]